MNLNYLNLEAQLEQAVIGATCQAPNTFQVEVLRAEYVKASPPTQPVTGAKPIQMDLMGDSTACTLLPGLQAVAPSFGVHIGNGAVTGCGIVSGRIAPHYINGIDVNRLSGLCQARATSTETALMKSARPNIIVWSSTWEEESIVATGSGNQTLEAGSPQWKQAMLSRVDARVHQFTRTGAKVVFVLPAPSATFSESGRSTFGNAAVSRLDQVLREVAARHPHTVGIVDLASRVCAPDGSCPNVVAGTDLRPDGEHFGYDGSLYAASWLVPQVLAAAQELHPA